MSNDLTDLSHELADKHNASEPEIWGYLAGLDAQGYSEVEARRRVAEEYGGSDE